MISQWMLIPLYLAFQETQAVLSLQVVCDGQYGRPPSSRSEVDALRWTVDRTCQSLSTQSPYQSGEFEFDIQPFSRAPSRCADSINAILASCTKSPRRFWGGWVVNTANYSISYKSLWDVNIAKGVPRFLALQQKLADPAKKVDKVVPSLFDRWRMTQSTVRPSEDLTTVMEQVPGYFGSASLTQIYTDSAGDGHYRNLFDAPGRIISAESNYANTHPIPELRDDRWSDIIFAEWIRVCHTTGTDPSQLRWIVRNNVRNSYTQKVLDRALGGVTQRSMIWFALTDAVPSAFYALSMTPNVLGAYWLCFDYPRSLGLYVARIGVMDIVRVGQGMQVNTFLVIELKAFKSKSFVHSVGA